ncbi:hypothetical protein AB205_0033800 [Aquarana catesbeiana]|uniref:Uncharacterized protein n=1 Tax=Aquarana catesbeiana TaxID=8400 RepID=A0A2G9RX43_AQUCT|nr:hypothetical protein AB205_0033800 [Aquarana catesbeiana]
MSYLQSILLYLLSRLETERIRECAELSGFFSNTLETNASGASTSNQVHRHRTCRPLTVIMRLVPCMSGISTSCLRSIQIGLWLEFYETNVSLSVYLFLGLCETGRLYQRSEHFPLNIVFHKTCREGHI